MGGGDVGKHVVGTPWSLKGATVASLDVLWLIEGRQQCEDLVVSWHQMRRDWAFLARLGICREAVAAREGPPKCDSTLGGSLEVVVGRRGPPERDYTLEGSLELVVARMRSPECDCALRDV